MKEFIEIINDIFRYYRDDSFEKAKLISDFVGMIARLVFLAILFGFITKTDTENSVQMALEIPALALLLAIQFHLGFLVSMITINKLVYFFDSIFGNRVADRKVMASIFSIFTVLLIVTTNWGVSDIIKSFSNEQVRRLEIRPQLSEDLSELRMPPPPIFN